MSVINLLPLIRKQEFPWEESQSVVSNANRAGATWDARGWRRLCWAGREDPHEHGNCLRDGCDHVGCNLVLLWYYSIIMQQVFRDAESDRRSCTPISAITGMHFCRYFFKHPPTDRKVLRSAGGHSHFPPAQTALAEEHSGREGCCDIWASPAVFFTV